MQGYEKYKESGVAWIGRIPEGWEIRRIATIGNFFKGKGIPKSFLSDSGFPAIVYGEIYTKYDISTSKTINFIPEESSEDLTYIEKGDLLFTGSGETREDIGKCIVYMGSNKVYIGGDIIVLRQEKINSLFLSYVLNSHISIYQRARMAKGEIVVHIYQSNLKEILFCLPSAIEQDHIANFLDKKTSEIDVLISQKEQLLVLYEEEKAAIINQAVTKGIDPNVKMKESGVPWLGKIPENWEVKRIGYSFNIIGSGTTPKTSEPSYY
ncbi:MAG: restriction endonuclease subunit S, partial [Sulfurovum sp.]|nr:restriction endonuclease subunit S [Sulfurovum sp.]